MFLYQVLDDQANAVNEIQIDVDVTCSCDHYDACSGHCPICMNPIDYCQGHSWMEWVAAAAQANPVASLA